MKQFEGDDSENYLEGLISKKPQICSILAQKIKVDRLDLATLSQRQLTKLVKYRGVSLPENFEFKEPKLLFYHVLRVEKGKLSQIVEATASFGELSWWIIKALIIRGEKSGFEMLKSRISDSNFAQKFSKIICKPHSDYISRQNGFAVNRMYGQKLFTQMKGLVEGSLIIDMCGLVPIEFLESTKMVE